VEGKNLTVFYSVALFSIILDQVSKYWMCRLLREPPFSFNIFRYFSLTLVQNKGICFGMLNTADIRIHVIGASIIIAVIIFIYFCRFAVNSRLMSVALGLTEGGIAGNLIDRVRIGSVIDFINLHVWPVFNLADMCIVSGIGLIFLKQIKNKS